MRLKLVLRLCVVTSVFAACGHAMSAEDGRAYVQDEISERREGISGAAPLYEGLADLLPNVTWAEINDAWPSRSFGGPIVVGRVADVQGGRSFFTTEHDHSDIQTVDFGDERAEWSTVHITLIPEDFIGDSDQVPDELHVGLPVDADVDLEAVEVGFKSLGRAVFFVFKPSPVFEYDSSLYALLEDSMVATVSDDGALALPFLEADRADKMLEDTPTLEALMAQSNQPAHTILFENQGGRSVRVTE